MSKEKIRLGICPGFPGAEPEVDGDYDLAGFVAETADYCAEYVIVCPDIKGEAPGQDSLQREDFIINTFVLKRWLDMLEQGKTPRNLVDFHSRHKYLIMARSVESYRRMGKLVAQSGELVAGILYQNYLVMLLGVLGLETTLPKHINVLQHIFGYFKKQLNAAEKQEVLAVFESFRTLQEPLRVPISLLKKLARKYEQPYLLQQVYLNPYLLEQRQRNHV
ncbi:YbgA family protein [uncultured Desulfuromusa sp.]|uniref:YbgA family protein n=1 Tax=uncultured Desulfuromusa sp. TaxID=219183 RepID=UPI002AA738B9|nr:YbgA family protein [uncultured Desulfuromusa sp.]